MKKLKLKQTIASTLVLAVALGGGSAAFADGKDRDNGHERHENREKDKDRSKDWKEEKRGDKHDDDDLKLDFDDLKGSDVEWALKYIASLASKRVFEGYEDGSFKPRNTITRIEAITAAVRLMGLRDQAESDQEKNTKLNFKDADKIPGWAVGYVSVALENDLFTESDDMVQPSKPADRLWATILLVKAMKLDAEAKAKVNTKLSFKDAKQIPAGAVGYVAVAVEKGLIDGFEDNTFRPNTPVTRAQLAALLDRTDTQIPDKDPNTAVGKVAGTVSQNTLVLDQNGTLKTYVLHPDAFVYRNGSKVNASALQNGDTVKLRSYNNTVVFIEVTKAAEADRTLLTTGFFDSMTLNKEGRIATITVTTNVNGSVQKSTYQVASNVSIQGDVNKLVPPTVVELKGKDKTVQSIVIK
ncbi:S-layer homology domain-containing protein [Paenibacillus sp. FJAT-26967]|uniref:S-layer homology domain-containing protein n=1 Tax=Paenibacillus sp. FJAT-26967 TaxID=1729690 RepID=UPI000837ECA6|nr:S-layer homology domain-containing protein [Paenibacillus sp. FJAT-26967]